MTDAPENIEQRIAQRLRELRTEHGFGIEELAARSGVSRSMISKIETGQTSPTAVVLNKLAIGLNVLLPAMFGYAPQGPARPMHPVARRRDQVRWQDPESGYHRRTLTPPGVSQPMQLTEIQFPPGARVTFENASGGRQVHQQVWMLKGEMMISAGRTPRRLTAGDCMAMTLDQPITFHNPGESTARYLVVIS